MSFGKVMPQKPIIQTERLILRQLCEDDLIPFAELKADSKVREYFPGVFKS